MENNWAAFDRAIRDALSDFEDAKVLQRIWEKDYTLWAESPDEVANRLGWLDIADRLQLEVSHLQDFAAKVIDDGFSHALLLGMGGSSLAPEVIRNTIGVIGRGLDLMVLDSTDPLSVKQISENLDLSTTLFIVATKSGGTVETLSFFKYFYNRLKKEIGAAQVGSHFVAITDPGSKLQEIADQFKFRSTFLNDPNIGGRYSALSLFGLVPAALMGVDVEKLLARGISAAAASRANDAAAVHLGVAMGVLANQGKNKLTFLISPGISSFGDWVEQLIAESTGKSGVGILPVVGEGLSLPEKYGHDRVFVGLSLPGDDLSRELQPLAGEGHPTVHIQLRDVYDLGSQFFIWELVTAIAGHVMGIQPFDQPDVEAAKIQARKMTEAYQESSQLPAGHPSTFTPEILAYFLEDVAPGDYVCLQIYTQQTREMDESLELLRENLTARTGVAVTAGYGPRFLHSTGQLHKGDAGNGWFIQIISKSDFDLEIPDAAGADASSITFQVLKRSQALGDYAALTNVSPPRRVIQFEIAAERAARLILDVASEL